MVLIIVWSNSWTSLAPSLWIDCRVVYRGRAPKSKVQLGVAVQLEPSAIGQNGNRATDDPEANERTELWPLGEPCPGIQLAAASVLL